MRDLASSDDWAYSPVDGNRRCVIPIPTGTRRLQLLAIFDEQEATAPWLQLPEQPRRNRWADFSNGSWLIHEDLGADAPPQVVVVTKYAPRAMLAQMMSTFPTGGAGVGVLPRSLYQPNRSLESPHFDLNSAVERLEQGDLDGAFSFAGKLCLAGETAMLSQFMRPLSNYIVSHPLHRGDQMGLFVAAVADARS